MGRETETGRGDDGGSKARRIPSTRRRRSRRYLLYLHGSACSGRLKNLLRCGSLVVFPFRAGGLFNVPDASGHSRGVVYEEFFYHRLVRANETVLRPNDLPELLPLVKYVRSRDDDARRMAEFTQERALRELSVEAAMCYWAVLLAEVAELQRLGRDI